MKRKLVTALAISIMVTNVTPTLSAYATNRTENDGTFIEEREELEDGDLSTEAKVSKFNIYYSEYREVYNNVYKVQGSNIKSISNNGGQYGGSAIAKAVDGDISTHWETGKSNNDNFTNEVIVTFDEAEAIAIDRIAYATRQDGARGKGFPVDAEIYVSMTDAENDFKLAGKTTGTAVTGDVVEYKFNTVNVKRVKFVFKKANQD